MNWELTITWDPEYREHVYAWRLGGRVVLEGYVAGNREDARRSADHARSEYEAKRDKVCA